MIEANTPEQVQQAVNAHDRIKVVGGGTKSALSEGANLSVGSLTGVLEYEPSEYTFTALAGTSIREIDQMLAEQGQFLPIDALFANSGSTLGGTIAAASSGPGRLRFGGVRDFLLGVRFVAGDGRIVFGGGKVVKNAAGFDLPKLMVGAQGQFGVLVELTFKVFPRPEGFASLLVESPDLESSISAMTSLANSPLEMFSLELDPPSRLWVRIAGISDALPGRIERIKSFLNEDYRIKTVDENVWKDIAEMRWVPHGYSLVKIPSSPTDIMKLESELADIGCPIPRRYSVVGNVVYLAWPESLGHEPLNTLLSNFGRTGSVLRGDPSLVEIGKSRDNAFGERLRSVLDPNRKFVNAKVATA